MKWKSDWSQVRDRFVRWWEGEGLLVWAASPRPKPIEDLPPPDDPPDDEVWWTDPKVRADRAEFGMARTFYGGEAFPYFDTMIGPGSLATFLGARPRFAHQPDSATVWYEPCIEDPDTFGRIRFEPRGNRWFQVHRAVIEEGLRRARGRYAVGMPDLVENLDTLAAMRGTEQLLLDLMERPGWVKERLAEINEAYFAAFDLLYERIRFDGGNVYAAFSVWGPGRTAKVQCDFSAMISPQMFREFVVPALAAQCEWLDYSLYHLDGTTALQHTDALLAIEALDAVEWTPQAGRPGGGSPEWFDLYRRIKAAGKAVQAVGVRPEEVVPLLDAVGPEGLCIMTGAPDPAAVERLLAAVESYR